MNIIISKMIDNNKHLRICEVNDIINADSHSDIVDELLLHIASRPEEYSKIEIRKGQGLLIMEYIRQQLERDVNPIFVDLDLIYKKENGQITPRTP